MLQLVSWWNRAVMRGATTRVAIPTLILQNRQGSPLAFLKPAALHFKGALYE